MLEFEIVTLFPEVFSYLGKGIIGRAHRKGLFKFRFWNPRKYASNGRVDDAPYGGGGGLVMLAEPLHLAISAAKEASPEAKLIYLSPQGKKLKQPIIKQMLQANVSYLLVAGRYEGFDERIFLEHPGEEFSIGDYVLSGGELAAMVLMDGLIRQIPGALGNQNSVAQESFQDKYLDYPHYTKPREWRGFKVPLELLSGDTFKINQWRRKQSLGRTFQRRPDLLTENRLVAEEGELLRQFLNETI